MTFFAKNMEVLRSQNPELFEKLSMVDFTEIPALSHGAEHTVHLSHPSKGYQFDEKFSGKPENTIWPHARLLIFLGFGLGSRLQLHLTQIRQMGPQVEVLIIEKDPQLFSMAMAIAEMNGIF